MCEYDRENVLKVRLNSVLNSILRTCEHDYYSRLAFAEILGLKSALSDINNVLTLRLAFALAKWLGEQYPRKPGLEALLHKSISRAKPNANGYDISCDDPNIVAEVKFNIPLGGGNAFGAAQRDGLIRDLKGLLHGKRRANKCTSESLKFLALFNADCVRRALESLVLTLPKRLAESVETVSELPGEPLCDRVYVVLLDPI